MRHGLMRLGSAIRAGLVAAATLAIVVPAGIRPAEAQIGSHRYAAIVLDSRSGNVLVAANADETRHPASLTKMMTLYMVFEAVREGRLSLQERIVFSEEAASRPPSKLGIPAGSGLTVEQAVLALVTRSANDVAAAVGEKLGGTEARFAQMMTLRARALGMTRTTFRNASGLPDPDQVTTARDMATLGRRLMQDFPDRYHYFGVTQARLVGQNIRNHNRMLDSYEGVDGIKTGYIRDSGFNIVTSASRGGHRVVGAVFGGSSWTERDAHMASLLDESFQSLGVARREERPQPVLVRNAAAATPRAAQSARATRPPQSAQLRPAATTQPRRPEARPARPGTVQAKAPLARPAATAVARPAATPLARPAAMPPRSTAATPTRSTAATPTRSTAATPTRSTPPRSAATPARQPQPAGPSPVPSRPAPIRTAELR